MKTYLLLLTCVLVSACSTVGNLQTAKTLPQGELEHTVAGSVGGINLDVLGDTSTAGTSVSVDYMLRYGLTDNDEIGFRVANFLSYYQADYKRSLYKSLPFWLSAGLGVGGTRVTIGTGAFEVKQTYIDLHVPIYMDYWVSESLALFAAPKYMLSFVSSNGDSDTLHRLGGSLGTKWGQSAGFLGEIGYLKDLGSDSLDLWQLSGGFFF